MNARKYMEKQARPVAGWERSVITGAPSLQPVELLNAAGGRLCRRRSAFQRRRRLERLAFRLGLSPHLLMLVIQYTEQRGLTSNPEPSV